VSVRYRYVVLALLATSCESLSPAQQLQVEMDAAVFSREASGTANASFTVRNVSGSELYFVGCRSPISARIERKTGAAWSEYLQSNTICQANLMPATLALSPGETYRDTFRWDLPAVYRLRVLFGSNRDRARTLEALGASFEIR
jgi:hypothetical protein